MDVVVRSQTPFSGAARRRFAGALAVVLLLALGLGLLVPYLFYKLRKPSWKQPEEAEVIPS